MGEVVTLPAQPAPVDLTALARQRAEHVLAIRAIDNQFAEEFQRRCSAAEEAAQRIADTAEFPTLPPAALDVARQTASWLPPMVQRVAQLFVRAG